MQRKKKTKPLHTVKALTGIQILKALGISSKQYKKDIKDMFNEKR